MLVMVLAACEGGQSPPLSDSTPGDGNAACGGGQIAGELIDWDSSTADFLGIAGAVVTQASDPSRTITTPPNGRMELCPHPDLPLEFVVDHPGTYLDGMLAIERDAVGTAISVRGLTAERAATFYSEHGLIFDPGLRHLVVHQTGDRQALSINATHDPALAASDDDGDGVLGWGVGTAGRYVLFPNIQGAIATVTISAPPSPPFTVRVAPGGLAMAVMFFVLVGP